MKLHQDNPSALHLIRSYADDHILINEHRMETAFIVSATQLIRDWTQASLIECTEIDWQPILALRPEILILGTGTKLRHPDPRQLDVFYRNRIGVEVMDTGAACRTYNVLLAEDRNVVAAIWFG